MELTDQYYTYLDELRDSGETNMMAAAPYLEAEFDLDRKQAKIVLLEWIKRPVYANTTKREATTS